MTIEECLSRRTQQILPTKSGLADLMSHKRIKLYQGFDPSSPNLHIGHLVGLLQLKAFQDLGHEVIFLIGDFTGMIGDPTDKSAVRPKLTHEQVLINAKTYKDYAGKIINFEGDNPAKIVFNFDWLSKLNFADLIEITSNITVQQLIERDMFQDRIKNERPIHLHEFLYPIAQGFDSVAMDVDLEVGGNDQMFNLMVGRQLMKAMKNKEKFCLTTKLLTDSDGRKIGKTTGNAINLFGEASELFGAIMSQPDSILDNGFELVTNISMSEISNLQAQIKTEPMKIKKRLAFEVVKLCQGESKANEAQIHFESTFQSKTLDNIESKFVTNHQSSVITLLSSLGIGASNGDRRRLIEQGAIEIDGIKLIDPNQNLDIKSGNTLKAGKHTYYKLIVK